jgi:hypothetical protein
MLNAAAQPTPQAVGCSGLLKLSFEKSSHCKHRKEQSSAYKQPHDSASEETRSKTISDFVLLSN